MKITILGGCGFIGSYLSEALLEANNEITIFDRLNSDRKNISSIEKNVKFVGGDFTNSRDLAKAITGAEIVVHAIGTTLPGNSLINPVYDIETNLVGSVKLLDECVKSGVRKMVFISSGGAIYGFPQSVPIKETHPLNPLNPYGLSKLAIEKYLGLYHYQYGLDYSVLRISNPFGERQNPDTGQGVVTAWIHQALKNKPIEIWGDGLVVRDYLYIKDAVAALKLATLTSTEEKIFNVGSGQGHSLLQIHETLEKVTGKKVQTIFKDARKVDVPVNILDASLIKATLGWTARIGLENGMGLMWQSLNK